MIPAYVLHTRPYRETSLLIEFFTLDLGRLSAIAHGAKRKKSSLAACSHPFTPLLIDFTGSTDLATLKKVEAQGPTVLLSGNKLLSGLYLNELMLRLLHRHDENRDIFLLYQDTLNDLSTQALIEPVLRHFEKKLLQALGYALNLTSTIEHHPIETDKYYQWRTAEGFYQVDVPDENSLAGSAILAFAEDDYSKLDTLHTAKNITRLALASLLGEKPLKTRELFRRSW